MPLRVFAVLIGVTLAGELALGGAVRVWDGGGADNRWLTPSNWVGDVAPAAGDTLAFPTNASHSMNNFPAYTRFDSLLISNTTHFTGNPVAINSGITVFATDLPHVPVFFMPVAMTAPQTFRVSTEGVWSVVRFLEAINTQGHEITLDPSGTNHAVDIGGDFNGSGGITGAGGVRKIGRGNVWLYASGSTYSGLTHIVEGGVGMTRGSALGSSAVGTIVEAGAELILL